MSAESTTNHLNLERDQNCILDENKDFITQVSEFIQHTTLTSMPWAEAIAMNLLSTIMGPERYLSDKKGKLNLNVWHLIIGPSGIGQKTTPMKTYLLPILAKVSENLDDNYPMILPSRYSVERMIGYMDERNMGDIVRDEFTSMFKEAYSKEYLADSLEFLSELYDGVIQPRATWSHGVNKTKFCYITFIAATTPYLFKVMKSDFFTQGTGNRILIVLFSIDSVQDQKYDPEDFFKGPAFEISRENFITEVAENLANLRHCNVKYFLPDEDAGEIWTKFEFECRTKAKERFKLNTFDLHYSYLSRLPEMTLKMSGVFALSRNWKLAQLEDCPPEMIITAQDMQRAVDKGHFHYNQFCNMMEEWRKRPEQAMVQSFEEQSSLILDKLDDNPQGIKWSELRKTIKWDTRTMSEVLKYLHQSEKMQIVRSDSHGGRKAIIFIKEGLATPLNSHKLNDWRIIESFLNLR